MAVLCPGKILARGDRLHEATNQDKLFGCFFFFFKLGSNCAFFFFFSPCKACVLLSATALLCIAGCGKLSHGGIPAKGGNYLIALIWAWVQLHGRHSAARGGVALCSCPKSACFALGRLDAVHKTL